MKIIQFPHPGNEHKYNTVEKSKGEKYWNKKRKHARNFIRADGTYIDLNGCPKTGSLTFWGEWEPCAKMQELKPISGTNMPKYMIEPIMPTKSPSKGQMNTDPLVFGEYFKYAICRQNERSDTLKNLDAGSIILFGCVRGTDFLLDTVFVVGNRKRRFSLFARHSLVGITEYDKYKRIVLDTFSHLRKNCFLRKTCNALNGCTCKKPLKLRTNRWNTYYEGVSFEAPFEGMYSFVPAKVFDSGNIGFERLKLDTMTQFRELRYKSLQNFYCVKEGNLKQMRDFWERLCKATEKAGLVKAVKIPYP